MILDDLPPESLWECCENGTHHVLSAEHIISKKDTYNRVWHLPHDTYWHNVQGYSAETPVYKKTGAKALEFGRLLHLRNTPLSQDEAENLLYPPGKELSSDAFVGLAARFNRIFKAEKKKLILPREYWPFYFCKVPGRRGIWRPAYRMNPRWKWLVIIREAKQ